MLQLIGGRRKGKKMEGNALKGDIYNGSDFTARKELRGSRCRDEEPRVEWRGGGGGRGWAGVDGWGRRDGGVKKRKEAQEHSRVEYEVGRRRRDGT